MAAYYNEDNPTCAAWLRNLIAGGLIAPGDVDDRDVRAVQPQDLDGYTQHHFFAGIGGWSLALRLAGWPDDRPVWTGSCPCQPFSTAGRRLGFEDPRHLWPEWHRLIRERTPAVIFGEQVARSGVWLDAVCADLERDDYAIGAARLPAVAVDARHIRERLWFVADAGTQRLPLPQRETVFAAGRRDQGRTTAECGWWSVEPAMGRVAHGVPGRVGQLRAIGNAIVPQLATAFIQEANAAMMEVEMVCPHCHGRGFFEYEAGCVIAAPNQPCPECLGSGVLSCCEGACGGSDETANDPLVPGSGE